jgi:hypothetical protein
MTTRLLCQQNALLCTKQQKVHSITWSLRFGRALLALR